MTVENKMKSWEAPTLAEIRVSAEVTAYVATK
ncbi:pyrroloquinoline quinone precursor peptide PqqA [Paenarthrobacter sp. NPDC091711]|nr:pyrroloquinoline quinone precursor peptide PqqA [Arthrobacter sp. 18067]